MKIAFFVEGDCEVQFLIEYILPITYKEKYYQSSQQIITSDKTNKYKGYCRECDQTNMFLICNICNDSNSTLLSEIKKNNKLIESYDFIFALLDINGENYQNLWNKKHKKKLGYDPQIIKTMKKNSKEVLKEFGNKIIICHQIMQFESWILSFYGSFTKINKLLTVNYISEFISDLNNIEKIPRPYSIINKMKILKYNKSNIRNILSKFDNTDVNTIIEKKLSHSLKYFIDKLNNITLH